MIYSLDTNICIYFLTGKYPTLLTKILTYHPDDIKIPAIVKAELYFGAENSKKRDENMNSIESFLLPFEIVPFDSAAAAQYGTIRAALEKAGKPIGPNDLLIAATSLVIGAVLVTNNTAEFSRVGGLALENWIL
jgi:tRNA(fMet)-specific endonuclease VapC